MIAQTLKDQNYLTQSELNQIQSDEKARDVPVVVQEDDNGSDQGELEEVADGEINPKEYDYLLSMPLWSLSEEKVEELNR